MSPAEILTRPRESGKAPGRSGVDKEASVSPGDALFCAGSMRSTGRRALSPRSVHFHPSLINPPGAGVVETSCTELNTRDRLISRRLLIPGLIWIRSRMAGTKLEKET